MEKEDIPWFVIMLFIIAIGVILIIYALGTYPNVPIHYNNVTIDGYETHIYGCKLVVARDGHVFTLKLPCTLRDASNFWGIVTLGVFLILIGATIIVITFNAGGR